MASAVFSATARALRAPHALGNQARSLAWIPHEFTHRRAALATVPGLPLRRLATRAEAAAASPVPPPAGVDPQQAFDSLKGQQVVLVSHQRRLDVTSLWGADERAVLVFARHMGGCRRRRRSLMLWWQWQQDKFSIPSTWNRNFRLTRITHVCTPGRSCLRKCIQIKRTRPPPPPPLSHHHRLTVLLGAGAPAGPRCTAGPGRSFREALPRHHRQARGEAPHGQHPAASSQCPAPPGLKPRAP
jgi:hypothetical protein